MNKGRYSEKTGQESRFFMPDFLRFPFKKVYLQRDHFISNAKPLIFLEPFAAFLQHV